MLLGGERLRARDRRVLHQARPLGTHPAGRVGQILVGSVGRRYPEEDHSHQGDFHRYVCTSGGILPGDMNCLTFKCLHVAFMNHLPLTQRSSFSTSPSSLLPSS